MTTDISLVLKDFGALSKTDGGNIFKGFYHLLQISNICGLTLTRILTV